MRVVELATGVAVLPVREPIILAKTAATLDVCSGGRVILGVGLGAYREEYRAVNPGKAPHRGKLMDERIAALQECGEFLLGEHLVADGDAPPAVDNRVESKQRCRREPPLASQAGHRIDRRRIHVQLRAEPPLLASPPRGYDDAEPGFL